MKKRAATVLAFLAVSLLLSGCDALPDNFDDFFNWSDSFFLKIDTSYVNDQLVPYITLLSALALCLALGALLINMYRIDVPWKGAYLTAVMIFFVIALLPVHIEVTTTAGSNVFESLDLILDDVMDALHWRLTADIAEAVTTIWAFNMTVNLPHICAFWQVVMVIATAIAMFVSILRRTLQGLVFSIAMVFGWLLFLSIYGIMIETIEKQYDPKPILSTAALYNGGYIFLTIMSLVFCYMVFPWLCASAVGYVESKYTSATKSEGDRGLSRASLLRAYGRSKSFLGRFKRDSGSRDEDGSEPVWSSSSAGANDGTEPIALLPPGPNKGPSPGGPSDAPDVGPKNGGPRTGPFDFPTSGSGKPFASDSNDIEEGVFHDVDSKNGDVLPMGPRTASTRSSGDSTKSWIKGSNGGAKIPNSTESEENLLPETVVKSNDKSSWLGKVANTAKLVGVITHEPRVIVAGEAAGVADEVISSRKAAKEAKAKDRTSKKGETPFNMLSALKDDPVEDSLLPETRKRG